MEENQIIDVDNIPEDKSFEEIVLERQEKRRTTDVLEMIKHWSHVFDEPIEMKPTRPTDHRIKLSNELIREEYKEFTDEIFYKEDLVNPSIKKDIDFGEVADALGDTLWVVVRAMYTYGINPLVVIGKIYESNMSKLCVTEEEAQLTVDCYADGSHPDKMGVEIETFYEPKDNYYLVKRQSDGKVLKSINFKKPNFSDL